MTGASKQHALIYIYWRTKAPPTFFKSRLAVLGNAVWPLHDLRLGFDTEVNVFKALSFACFRKDLGFGFRVFIYIYTYIYRVLGSGFIKG